MGGVWRAICILMQIIKGKVGDASKAATNDANQKQISLLYSIRGARKDCEYKVATNRARAPANMGECTGMTPDKKPEINMKIWFLWTSFGRC